MPHHSPGLVKPGVAPGVLDATRVTIPALVIYFMSWVSTRSSAPISTGYSLPS